MPDRPKSEPLESFSPLPTNKSSKVRLVISALVLGVLLSVGISFLKVAANVDMRAIYLGLDQLRFPLAVIALTAILLLVVTIWIRPRWRTILGSAALLFAALYACTWLLRIESFYGGLIPRFAWSWAPTAEEEFEAYQTQLVTTGNKPDRDQPFVGGEFDFPAFLGTNRDGVIRNVRLHTDWSEQTPRELWRHPVGLGWGGFAVVGESAITQEQRGPNETIVCYNLQTGHEMWAHGDPIRFRDEHGDGPRATPTVSGTHVYSMGATGLLNCLDARSGDAIWQVKTLPKPNTQNLLWGMSGSPLLIDDVVIVSPGGRNGGALMAFDREDGQLAWSGGDDPAAYASPFLLEVAGRRNVVSFNGEGLRGFDTQGNPLWLQEWLTQGTHQRVNVSQPFVVQSYGEQPQFDAGYVLISAGYSMGTALLRITTDGDNWAVAEVWASRYLNSKMSNFVVHEGFIYGLDNGVLTCLDLQDGRRIWKRGRYGHGQLLLVNGVLLIQAESGRVALVKATPEEFRELASLDALSDKTWNHATLCGSVLLVRNDREAAAFELPTID